MLPLIILAAAADPAALTNGEPKSPAEERATFQLSPGYRVDLVAAEPEVIDPVAMCFDAAGAVYVCEMIGYPNGGVATGIETRGRVRKLIDRDGDGRFETATVFADGLRFPTGICCWRDGVIVANAPDITYYRDTDGDGRADAANVLYTGFDLRNIQQLPNALQFHSDGRVYAMVGLNGGNLTCPGKPDMPPLPLRGRGVRFDPDTPGKIEPTSGGGQYGLTHDGRGHWFTNTNAQHLRQIVVADEYLRRNPHFAAAAVTADIPEHGPAAKVFRVSPFEAWRLERTTRRKGDPAMVRRLPTTELVPGGYFTSACSPLVYRGTQFDPRTVLVCDPANNLVHREKLHDTDSPMFVARRIDTGREFFASTDNWCRPVFLSQGPDDAVYMLDFYREAIETPLSLPDDLKKRMNLESRQRGRVWRIAKSDNPPQRLRSLAGIGTEKLRDALESNASTAWVRDTAFRLLAERVTPADATRLTPTRPSTTWLQLLAVKGVLPEKVLKDALATRDDSMLLPLAEPFLASGKSEIASELRKRLRSDSPQTRFQAVLSLGADPGFSFTSADAAWLKRDVADQWFAAGVLTSMKSFPPEVLKIWIDEPGMPTAFLTQLGQCYAVAHRESLGELPNELLAKAAENPAAAAALDGLATGLRNAGGSLDGWWSQNPVSLAKAAALFKALERRAVDDSQPTAARVKALRLLELRPSADRIPTAAQLLGPTQPPDIQTACVQSLSATRDPGVAKVLLAAWPKATPGVRSAIEEALLARPERIEALFAAVEARAVGPGELGASRVDQLRAHRTPAVRDRAAKLFAAAVNTDRQKVVNDYNSSLSLHANNVRGKLVFAKNCAACHRLENVGNDVGANLTAALPNKTKTALLLDIFDPSREVDSRYVNYTVQTLGGRTATGILAVETATSLTLRRGDKAEDTILRNDIASLTASKKSLMPEDMEKVLSKQDVADLLEYLVTVGR